MKACGHSCLKNSEYLDARQLAEADLAADGGNSEFEKRRRC
jgi:hypothetical protein